MKWSRYNLLFESKRNGWLLYNSASNSFLKLDSDAADKVRQVEKDPEGTDLSSNLDLYFHLRNGGFLVEDSRDDDFFRILKMKRLTENYAGHTLLLTIAPTRACNFICPYCYEENKTVSMMTDETEAQLINFIKLHKKISDIAIIWYGGEPLLAIDRIRSINKKISELGKDYTSMIVTNGYLLDDNVISILDELKLKKIQITLDGNKETHDSRRCLKGGGPTFDKIVSNMKNLMNSDWKGMVHVRVNVDGTNKSEFAYVYRFIEELFPKEFGKRIIVYPGFVHNDDPNPDTSCFFDSWEKGNFIEEMHNEYGINALSMFPSRAISGCTLTRRNAYVVGPDGELYKCWNDVGIPELVIGNISSFTDWNMPLVAEGMVGASYLEESDCEKCFYFPICDGGCPKKRMMNKRDGGNRDTCSYFKGHIENLLEMHYEEKYGK